MKRLHFLSTLWIDNRSFQNLLKTTEGPILPVNCQSLQLWLAEVPKNKSEDTNVNCRI